VIVLGRLAIDLALVLSLAGVLFLGLGMGRRDHRLIRNGYYVVYGFFLATVVASAVLLSAFLNKDFSFLYVFQNSDASLSTFYRIAGFWAGQQGSFLLWLQLLAVVAVVIALRNLRESDRLTAGAVMVICLISAAFATLMVFDQGSQPFVKNAAVGAAPLGLNPLLLHPAMVLHPPALFMGYVGLAVPFAFAVSTLIVGRSDTSWVQRSHGWTIAGWALLSLGIGLGAWWAYVVLSWGGYWGWDPVESTSLIPWLTTTALLHSANLSVKRGVFKRWTLCLAAATFWLTLVATWVTRTGLITSVHAFEERRTLVYILSTFVVVVAVASVALIAARWRRFAGEAELGSLLSRDFMHYLTNVVLSLFAGAILFATVVVPLVTSNGRSVGPQTFNAFAQPLGVVVLLGMALCSLLSWRHTEGRKLWRALLWPALVAVLSVPLFVFTGNWTESLGGFAGLVACVFAGAAVVESMVVRARMLARDAGALTGLWRALTASRTRTAGFVAHVGMVLVVLGLLGSNVYKVESHAFIAAKPGSQAGIGAYTLRFIGMHEGSGPQGSQRTYAAFAVFKNGRRVATLQPRTDVYPSMQAAVRAVILGSAGQDLFVAPNAPFTSTSTNISLQLDVFPLVRLVWAGALLLVVGAAVSLWPRPRRVAEPVAGQA